MQVTRDPWTWQDTVPIMFTAFPQRDIRRRRRALAGGAIEVLEQRTLLADGITPQGAPQLDGTVGVPLSNVAVATFSIASSAGAPGTKWNAKVEWGDGAVDERIVASAGAGGTFQIVDSHTYSSTGSFTITVMIAVPGSHDPDANVITTQALIQATTTSATLKSIAVTPANPSLAQGSTQALTATGTFSDNSTQNLTGQVTWASSNPSVATINAAGVATGGAAGTSTITATLKGITGSTALTVATATSPPTGAPPQVVGSVAVSQSRKGTSYTLTFNESLNPASANTPSLYHVFEGVTKVVKRKKETVYTKPLKIKGVSYNNSTQSVAVTLARKFTRKVQVVVASGLESASGATTTSVIMVNPS